MDNEEKAGHHPGQRRAQLSSPSTLSCSHRSSLPVSPSCVACGMFLRVFNMLFLVKGIVWPVILGDCSSNIQTTNRKWRDKSKLPINRTRYFQSFGTNSSRDSRLIKSSSRFDLHQIPYQVYRSASLSNVATIGICSSAVKPLQRMKAHAFRTTNTALFEREINYEGDKEKKIRKKRISNTSYT